MRYYNAKSESTPDDGIVPDIYIPDGYTVSKKEIGDVSETLLNAALSLILNQSNTKAKAVKDNQFETSLTLIGEPSYVTEFKTKHYNENN
jgi:C-terminal processing protease CtpA/Prc